MVSKPATQSFCGLITALSLVSTVLAMPAASKNNALSARASPQGVTISQNVTSLRASNAKANLTDSNNFFYTDDFVYNLGDQEGPTDIDTFELAFAALDCQTQLLVNIDRTAGVRPSSVWPFFQYICFDSLGDKIQIQPFEERTPMTYLTLSQILRDIVSMFNVLGNRRLAAESDFQVWRLPRYEHGDPDTILYKGTVTIDNRDASNKDASSKDDSSKGASNIQVA